MRAEPGDIIAIDFRTGSRHAFVIETKPHQFPNTIMLRWLDEGVCDSAHVRACRVVIKRYHVLLGMSIGAIDQSIYERSMIQPFVMGSPYG